MPDIRELLTAAAVNGPEPAPDVDAIIRRGRRLRLRRRVSLSAVPVVTASLLLAPILVGNSGSVEELEVVDRGGVGRTTTTVEAPNPEPNPELESGAAPGHEGRAAGSSGPRRAAARPAGAAAPSQSQADPIGTSAPAPELLAGAGPIVYASNKHGSYDIFTANIDGTGARRLTATDGVTELHPAWSPDRRRIAFVRQMRKGDFDIFVMNADGSDVRQLTDAPGNDLHPAFSPDGLMIAFVSERDGERRGSISYAGEVRDVRSTELWLMRADGSGQRQVYDTSLYDVVGPSWSPDGRRLVVEQYNPNKVSAEIAIVDVASRTVRAIYFADTFVYTPAWSPDGDWIAFREARNGGSHIAVIAAEGGRYRVVTPPGGTSMHPEWSGNSKAILYSFDVDGTRYHTNNPNSSLECSAYRTPASPNPADVCPAGPAPSELRVIGIDGAGAGTLLRDPPADVVDGDW
jgi:hypothetical protein